MSERPPPEDPAMPGDSDPTPAWMTWRFNAETDSDEGWRDLGAAVYELGQAVGELGQAMAERAQPYHCLVCADTEDVERRRTLFQAEVMRRGGTVFSNGQSFEIEWGYPANPADNPADNPAISPFDNSAVELEMVCDPDWVRAVHVGIMEGESAGMTLDELLGAEGEELIRAAREGLGQIRREMGEEG